MRERHLARRAAAMPPPTSPAVEIVWCGARNGRGAGEPARRARPQALAIRSDLERLRRGAAAAGSRAAAARRATCRRRAGRRSAGCARRRRRPRAPSARYGLAPQVGEVGQRRAASAFERQPAPAGGAARPSCRATRAARSRAERDHRARRRRAPPRARSRPGPRAPRRRPRARRLGHRERPGDRPDRAVERELAGEREPSSRSRRELPGGGEERRRDREVEARARLAQVGRREVGGDPLLRELEPRVDERRPHPLARLAHRGVGQADQREGRQPGRTWTSTRTAPRLDAEQREGAGGGEHGAKLGRPARAWRADVPIRGADLTMRATRRAARRLRVGADDRRPPERSGARRRSWSPMRLERRGLARSSRATPAPRRSAARSTSSRSTARALVFVEVKARSAGAAVGPERPAMAVGAASGTSSARSRSPGFATRRPRPAPRADCASTSSACASTRAGARSSGSTFAARSDAPAVYRRPAAARAGE